MIKRNKIVILIMFFMVIGCYNPAKADIINTMGGTFPVTIAFSVGLLILTLYSYRSIKKDLKQQEQAQNEIKEE